MPPSLNAARRGYRYQDLISAYVLARAIRIRRGQTMSFDRPLRTNDRFDDVDLRSAGTRLRRQIKFSSTEDPVLDVAAFTTTARRLRIDDLVASAVQDDCFEGATYVVTTPQ